MRHSATLQRQYFCYYEYSKDIKYGYNKLSYKCFHYKEWDSQSRALLSALLEPKEKNNFHKTKLLPFPSKKWNGAGFFISTKYNGMD
jgi:hypothetical protein